MRGLLAAGAFALLLVMPSMTWADEATYNTPNGPKTLSDMYSELAAAGYGGPWDDQDVIANYATTTGGDVTPVSPPDAVSPPDQNGNVDVSSSPNLPPSEALSVELTPQIGQPVFSSFGRTNGPVQVTLNGRVCNHSDSWSATGIRVTVGAFGKSSPIALSAANFITVTLPGRVPPGQCTPVNQPVTSVDPYDASAWITAVNWSWTLQ
jgi:hypothetical protein